MLVGLCLCLYCCWLWYCLTMICVENQLMALPCLHVCWLFVVCWHCCCCALALALGLHSRKSFVFRWLNPNYLLKMNGKHWLQRWTFWNTYKPFLSIRRFFFLNRLWFGRCACAIRSLMNGVGVFVNNPVIDNYEIFFKFQFIVHALCNHSCTVTKKIININAIVNHCHSLK